MSVVPSASLMCRQNLINITQTNIQMNILFRYPTSHLELLSLVFRNKHYQISAKEDRANQLLCCILLYWGRAHKYYEICLIHQPSHDKIGYCLHQLYRLWLNGYHIFFLSKTSYLYFVPIFLPMPESRCFFFCQISSHRLTALALQKKRSKKERCKNQSYTPSLNQRNH